VFTTAAIGLYPEPDASRKHNVAKYADTSKDIGRTLHMFNVPKTIQSKSLLASPRILLTIDYEKIRNLQIVVHAYL
jgi:hypothetical protein